MTRECASTLRVSSSLTQESQTEQGNARLGLTIRIASKGTSKTGQ